MLGVFKKKLRCCGWFALCALLTVSALADPGLPEVRAVTLKYGTANWELQLIQARELDLKHGFRLSVHEVSSPSAASIALQAGEADVAVQDWLWVLRQRQSGRHFRFAPFSSAVGRLMVPPGSDLHSIADLQDIALGVAGGDADKSWRLLSLLVLRDRDERLSEILAPKFGSPPLLNQLALRGDLDAVLTYWHYAARLEAHGFKTLISVDDVLARLGIPAPLPMLGWSFSEDFERSTGSLAADFYAASMDAKNLLATDSKAWEFILPWMRAGNSAEFNALKQGYIAGIPAPMSPSTIAAITTVAALYLGESPEGYRLDPEIFWQPPS